MTEQEIRAELRIIARGYADAFAAYRAEVLIHTGRLYTLLQKSGFPAGLTREDMLKALDVQIKCSGEINLGGTTEKLIFDHLCEEILPYFKETEK